MRTPTTISRRTLLRRTKTIGAAIGLPTLILTVAMLGSPNASAAIDGDRPPNIVLIFADDQGYGDLGSYGSPLIRTPHLDRMAREGVRFTSFYSANSVCSASRAALLTGCYPPRVSVLGVLWPGTSEGLHPDEITIADVLKERGYATACIGKWHLGDRPNMLPTAQGFDSYFGVPFSNDMYIDPNMALADDIRLREGMTVERIRTEKPKHNWVPLMRDDKAVEYPCDQSTLTKRYTEEAVKFITANRAKPFFLYLPHTMPHIPLFASEDFRDTSERGLYGDIIEEMDWGVGEILKTLKELQLDENTLVIYTSDNGPWDLPRGRGGSAGPLRGFKFQTYEGGMRVPCIMRWPGKIPADIVSFEVAGTIDLLPTIARLAGADLPEDRVIDGKDIWPLMTGDAEARTPHDNYYYYKSDQLEAMRSGNWKLRRSGVTELKDLRRSIGNSRDLAENHPTVYRRLLDGIDNLNIADLRALQEDTALTNPLSSDQRGLIRRLIEKMDTVQIMELFNLKLDVSESRNLADANPDVVQRLIAEMDRFDGELKAQVRPAAVWPDN